MPNSPLRSRLEYAAALAALRRGVGVDLHDAQLASGTVVTIVHLAAGRDPGRPPSGWRHWFARILNVASATVREIRFARACGVLAAEIHSRIARLVDRGNASK